MSSAQEIDVSVVSQDLKLLPDFLLHVPIVRVKLAELVFEAIDFVELKFLLSNRIDAVHDLDKPAPRLNSLVSEKKRPLPLSEHELFGLGLPVSYEKDFSGVRNLI
jgi:hypothetical protein